MKQESILFVTDDQVFTVRVEKHGVTFIIENGKESRFFLNHSKTRSVTEWLKMKAEERNE